MSLDRGARDGRRDGNGHNGPGLKCSLCSTDGHRAEECPWIHGLPEDEAELQKLYDAMDVSVEKLPGNRLIGRVGDATFSVQPDPSDPSTAVVYLQTACACTQQCQSKPVQVRRKDGSTRFASRGMNRSFKSPRRNGKRY